MHWQAGEAAISKHVRCISGWILDVVVDIRKGSKTWGQWCCWVLKGGNDYSDWHKSLVVPKGFAHGFQTLSKSATVLYEQDGLWSPEDERSFHPLDPDVAIAWDQGGGFNNFKLSKKDAGAGKLCEVPQSDLNFAQSPGGAFTQKTTTTAGVSLESNLR